MTGLPRVRLDDLYKMVAYIYSDRNLSRPAAATFGHFVEVCGMLTIHDRSKKREGLDVADALCKALGWYFPLLAKMGVQSVEEIVFRKFPRVCPYCRKSPHDEVNCKLVKGTDTTVNHAEVNRYFDKNWDNRPTSLNEWQDMFQEIYPRRVDERGRSVIGLFEEVGELAEAVRVFEAHPKYFLGEAADTFSYLMGIANEHKLRAAQTDLPFSFEEEFVSRYPGLCLQCGSKLCVCPAIPEATVGRMAKELDIGRTERPFIQDIEGFSKEGRSVGDKVLEALGGHKGLSGRLPFDRGDANRALVALCLQLASAVDSSNHSLAEKFRAEALRITSNAQLPGSRKKPIDLDGLLRDVEGAWKGLGNELRSNIRNSAGLVGELGAILDTVRVLYVFCSPMDEASLRVSGELRVIQQCAERRRDRAHLHIVPLPAATATDFRRSLAEHYDIIHFAGHADERSLVFETESGDSDAIPIEIVAEAISRNPHIKAVVLNACKAAANLPASISPITIGMTESIEDDAALEFTRGFYDAIVMGKTPEEACNEGKLAVQFAKFDASHITLLKKP